jgi:RNA 3'-terminal phosphate cyclase (GTP)
MIEIDGSQGEGGGSILRQAISLSLITKKPFRIINIRANRPNPGLNHQHLASIELAQRISNSKVIGANVNSQIVEFYPGKLSSKEINLDIGSAGSIVLALQSVILPCVVSGQKFKFNIIGGTDVSWSPSIDFFKDIFLPCLENYGKIDLQINRRGYYPKGNGSISLVIQGSEKQSSEEKKEFLRTSVGSLVSIKGIINTSKNFWKNYAPEKISELSKLSLSGFDINCNIMNLSSERDDEGASFLFYAVFENPIKEDKFIRVGVSEIARDEDELIKKIEIESVKLKKIISEKIPVDEYLADQLISLMGIFGGKLITDNISNHTKSNIFIAELFLEKKFKVVEHNNKKEIIYDLP